MIEQIRDYKIIKKIGEGGMGTVYLASDTMLERNVAIKVLNPLLTKDSQFTDRFRHEAKVQASLIHPNIVTLYNYFREGDNYCMVMEYVEGDTLKQLITNTGPLPEQKVIWLLNQILEAVGSAHKKGIIHRDIKPSNILLTGDNTVKILDFGIAKILQDKGLTKTGTKMGTIYYMSPEQIKAVKDIDHRTDIYSIGVTLYEMLSGRIPFNVDTDSDFEIMNEIVTGEIKDPREYYPHISDWLVDILFASVHKDRTKRIQNTDEFTKRLLSKEGKAAVMGTADKTIIEEPKTEIKEPKKTVKVPPLTTKTKNKRNITIIAGIILIVIIGLVLLKQSSNKTVIKPNKRTEVYSNNSKRNDSYKSKGENPIKGTEINSNNSKGNDFYKSKEENTIKGTEINSNNSKGNDSYKSKEENTIKGTEVNSNNSKGKDFFKGKLIKTLRGHSHSVRSVTYSPDGKCLASGSNDETIKIWNMVTGKEVKTLRGHNDEVTSVTYSPDGKYLASGSYKIIKIWNAATGREIKTLTGYNSWVLSVAYSPHGKYLASGGADNTIKILNMVTGKEVKTLRGHNDWVESVTYSPDGKYLASGSEDKTIKIWNAITGEEIKTLTGHNGYVFSVTYSPDGKYLASGSADHTIKIWNALTGREIKTLTGHTGSVLSVTYSPDGKYLASGSTDHTIKIWNAVTGEEIKTLTGHTGSVLSVTYSPDGKYLANGSADKTIKIWNAVTSNTK